MRVRIFSVSLNPNEYNLQEISQMGYDEAKTFFLAVDEIGACNVKEFLIDQTNPHEASFHCDGVSGNDGSDTMFNWIKIEEEETYHLIVL